MWDKDDSVCARVLRGVHVWGASVGVGGDLVCVHGEACMFGSCSRQVWREVFLSLNCARPIQRQLPVRSYLSPYHE